MHQIVDGLFIGSFAAEQRLQQLLDTRLPGTSLVIVLAGRV